MSSEHKLDRAFQRILRFNPALTRDTFVQNLRQSISASYAASAKSKILTLLTNAGSFVKFLQNYKQIMKERMNDLASGTRTEAALSSDDGTYIPLHLFFLILFALFSAGVGGIICLIFSISFMSAWAWGAGVVVLVIGAIYLTTVISDALYDYQVKRRTPHPSS